MPDIIEYIKVTDRGFVTFLSFENFYKYRDITPREYLNLDNNKCRGLMSKKQKKSIATIINNWVTSVVWFMKSNHIHKAKIGYYLSFCTLTLSANQLHCDKLIKRECLNTFLIYIKRKYRVKNYIWISEKQQNGNIHFHIILDRFIHHSHIRNTWNFAQQKLGYISRFEQKHGHNDPNSTDIKSLKSINNPSAYLIKYLSKSDKNQFQCGRMWNCSERLKQIETFTTVVDNNINQILSKFEKENPRKIYKSEFFHVLHVDKGGIDKTLNEGLRNQVKNFYLEQYKFLNSE